MQKFMKSAFLTLMALSVSLMLCGCGGDTESEQQPAEAPSVGEHISVGVPEDDLQFDLQYPEDPGFTEGVDLSNVPDYSRQLSDTEPMYVTIEGYAYMLDPATLEPTGDPLDPVTHLPIDQVQVANEPTESVGEVAGETPAGEVPVEPIELADGVVDNDTSVVDHASAEEPTEETKYPNTGIFLEDD